MVDLSEYWGKISASEKFKDLEPDQREKVRQHLFNSHIQKSQSYLDLPQSKRIAVRKHFDDVTQIKDEGMLENLARKGKKLIAAAEPIIEKGKRLAGSVKEAAVEAFEDPYTRSNIQALLPGGGSTVEIPGAKKAASLVSGAAETVAEKVEPDFVKPSLTSFDMARAIGGASVRTVGDFAAGLIPQTNVDAAIWGLLNPVFKYAGTTFLGKDLHLPGWKPKTGLSSSAAGLGDEIEKIVTKRRIENNGRQMAEGPPKPLEVLARKEEELLVEDQLSQYQSWLEQADKVSPSGGVPTGDIYPEAKVNVLQLRDFAQERLLRLQNEPVRVESLSKAEDALQGYYRRKVDQARVFLMPSGPEIEAQALLPAGPSPSGLLGEGKIPRSPAEKLSLSTSIIPEPRPGATPPGAKAGDVVRKMYQVYNPDQTKQSNAVRAGSLLKSMGMRPGEELTEKHMKMLEKILEMEHSERLAKEAKIPEPSKNLKEKGLDPIEVKTEAKRLADENEAIRKARQEAKTRLKEVTGGIGFHDPDPVTGRRPEAEEVLRNVPLDLRGKTKPDQAAQLAYEAGIIPGPSSNDLFNYTKNLESAGKPRSAKSFLAEAEYRLENEMQRKSGFKPEARQESIPGTPGAEMPKTGLGGVEGQVPQESLLEGFQNQDIQQKSLFDIMGEIGDYFLKGEKGGIGGKDLDPVKQAALEANVKELVDRAMSLGYQTTQDIMVYAAKNAPKEIQDAIRKNLAPTLSPFDTHAYKEMESAKAGSPIAKKSLMDSAMRDYLKEKYEWAKGTRKRRSVSKIIGQFHDGDEAKLRLMNDFFIHDYYRKFSKFEDAAQRWYIEGKAPGLDALKHFVPEDDAKEMLRLFREPTELMKSAKAATQAVEDEYHGVVSEFYDSLGYAENHVTRRWKQPREYLNWEGRTLGDQPNFMKGRKLLSQADGINAGYEPKSLSIKDDLRASNDVRVRLLTRLHDLRKIAATFDAKGMPSIMLEKAGGQSSKANITPHTGKAPDNWLRDQGVPLLRGLAINPDYKPAIDYIFGARYRSLPIGIYEHLGSLSKASILGYSLFHPASLTEMLLGGLSYRNVFTFNVEKNAFAKLVRNFAKAATADLEDPLNWKKPIESINALYKSFMSGHAALANRPLALDMAEHGFKLGSVDDVNYNILSRTLLKYEGWLKARELSMPKGKASFKEAREIVSGIRSAGDLLQKFMWDYQRPLFSMTLYENHLADNIKRFNLDAPVGNKIPIDQIKFSTSNFVSKMVGGISMGTLLVAPRAQQFLQWAMMAPDWTIGRALMPAASIGVGPTIKGYSEGGFRGAVRGFLRGGPETRQARKLMLRMGVSYFVFGNLLNYHNSQKNAGKGRWMWENDPGHEMEIVWRKDPKGRTVYIQVSKAFTEIYDDLTHPAKTAAYKANPNIHAAVKLMNWATSGSFKSTLRTEGPIQTVKGMFVPRTFSGLNAYGTFPIHRGISRAQVMDMFEEYYRTGNQKFLDQAMRYGMESNFDVTTLERSARARHAGQLRRKEREAILQ